MSDTKGESVSSIEVWDQIKSRDPYDPITQLEIMREKAEKQGCGVSHQYNVIRRALSQSADPGLSGSLNGLPEQWRRSAEAIKRNNWPSADARHFQLYECSYELERAIAAAQKTTNERR